MYPIFVVEGPDCAGKSTLCKELVRRTRGHYLHSIYRFKGRMPAYHTRQLLKALRESHDRPVIMDRWWPSEIAYANVYRKGSEHPTYWRGLHRIALRYGIVYVWCVPGRLDMYLEFARKNWTKGGPQDYPFATASAIWEQYRDLKLKHYHNFSRALSVHYDVTYDTHHSRMFVEWLLNTVIGWRGNLTTEDKDFLKETDFHWSGNLFDNPRHVLVGNIRDVGKRSWWPIASSVSGYKTRLWDAAIGTRWSETPWLFVDTEKDPRPLIDRALARRGTMTDPAQIIASGIHAQALLKEYNIVELQELTRYEGPENLREDLSRVANYGTTRLILTAEESRRQSELPF